MFFLSPEAAAKPRDRILAEVAVYLNEGFCELRELREVRARSAASDAARLPAAAAGEGKGKGKGRRQEQGHQTILKFSRWLAEARAAVLAARSCLLCGGCAALQLS